MSYEMRTQGEQIVAKMQAQGEQVTNEAVVHSNYILHPQEKSKVIGKVTRLGNGSYRGVLFKEEVALKSIADKGSDITVDTGSAILRKSAQAAKWALSHLYKSRLTDQPNSNKTIPNPT